MGDPDNCFFLKFNHYISDFYLNWCTYKHFMLENRNDKDF
jgi:hypothetical protein